MDAWEITLMYSNNIYIDVCVRAACTVAWRGMAWPDVRIFSTIADIKINGLSAVNETRVRRSSQPERRYEIIPVIAPAIFIIGPVHAPIIGRKSNSDTNKLCTFIYNR